MALKVYTLDRLLELEGTGGSAIPYLAYVEGNLQIPGIKGYNKDVLLLVIPTTTYSEKVPVLLGSKIIDRMMGMIMKGELARATITWKQAHFSTVVSQLLQLPCRGVRGDGDAAKGATSSITPDPTVPKKFCLDDVQWYVHTTWRVTIPLFGIVNIHSNTKGIACGSTCLLSQHGPPAAHLCGPNTTYGESHLGLSWVPICLRNMNAHPMAIPAKVVIGQVALANQVPPVVLPVETSGESAHGP